MLRPGRRHGQSLGQIRDGLLKRITFGFVDAQDGLLVESTGTEAVDGLSGEGHQLAILNRFSAGLEVGRMVGLDGGAETGLVEGSHKGIGIFFKEVLEFLFRFSGHSIL